MIWRREERNVFLANNTISKRKRHKQQLFTDKDEKELIKILMMPALNF